MPATIFQIKISVGRTSAFPPLRPLIRNLTSAFTYHVCIITSKQWNDSNSKFDKHVSSLPGIFSVIVQRCRVSRGSILPFDWSIHSFEHHKMTKEPARMRVLCRNEAMLPRLHTQLFDICLGAEWITAGRASNPREKGNFSSRWIATRNIIFYCLMFVFHAPIVSSFFHFYDEIVQFSIPTCKGSVHFSIRFHPIHGSQFKIINIAGTSQLFRIVINYLLICFTM